MLSQKNIFNAIQPFEVSATYVEMDANSSKNVFESHIHNECEIYINLSGDVSFAVENSIYPISPGSIIITRPFEYHHCVYHSNKLHKHFCIFFSANGNEYLFNKFYNRKVGEGNLLMLEKEKTEELISACEKLTSKSGSELEKYINFFRLILLIDNATATEKPTSCYPDIIINAMLYINSNLPYSISVGEISKKVNVSVNTLERYFMQYLNVSPTAYIQKRRLSNAAKLLSEGYSVTEASEKSGFPSCSAFISLFRKAYGQTPHTYKKAVKKI